MAETTRVSIATESGPAAVAEMNHESVVMDRYAEGATDRQADLCCPVSYDPKYLAVLPAEIIERDYGCGDPSVYVEEGERVLDLGSGGGKICYILSQKVGEAGRVIGVDMNESMLGLARKYQGELAEKIGWSNVDFKKGRIQDLQTDLEACEARLASKPATDLESLGEFEEFRAAQRASAPLIADSSIDAVVSNCVLNLVRPGDRNDLFGEIFRVLARGGRAVISDIVADEPVPSHLRENPELWSGCISGAMQESEFLAAFEEAGFHGIEILNRQEEPWQTVEGIEFRSVTVRAYKGKQGPCFDKNQAVIYRGPFRAVEDDDGHRYERGARAAVCEKTFNLLKRTYSDQMYFVEPHEEVTDPGLFDCSRDQVRHPRETKGLDYDVTTEPTDDCCAPGSDCC